MNEDSTKKAIEPPEPAESSLEEMPELDGPRFRRRAGRGHHAGLSVGEVVAIDADLWSHFGSAQAVNEALRRIVQASRNS